MKPSKIEGDVLLEKRKVRCQLFQTAPGERGRRLFSLAVSTPQYFIFMVMGWAAPSSGRPLVMGALAHAATSPSPVASMYTLADTLFSPSLLQSVRLLTSPSAVSTAPRKVWNRTFTPRRAQLLVQDQLETLRVEGGDGAGVLLECRAHGRWSTPRRTSSLYQLLHNAPNDLLLPRVEGHHGAHAAAGQRAAQIAVPLHPGPTLCLLRRPGRRRSRTRPPATITP